MSGVLRCCRRLRGGAKLLVEDVLLEEECWRRLLGGLERGRLSFRLRCKGWSLLLTVGTFVGRGGMRRCGETSSDGEVEELVLDLDLGSRFSGLGASWGTALMDDLSSCLSCVLCGRSCS